MYNSQTPIDIHCTKLVDWLIQRRHCKKDWGENLATVRRKIRVALKDMPENEEIKDLLIGSKLDYFKSKRIVELLKTTEASSKNIFGFYSSQRMKDWQDIISSYERDCIYLAEVATDLIRETNYEIPGIRKVIGKLRSERDEAEKERQNLLRRMHQFNSEYQRLAQSYGIKGINVAQELEEQAKTLEDVVDCVVSLAKDLENDVSFYQESAKLTSKQEPEAFIPMLQYIIRKGNTTVYEWIHGQVPDSIQVSEKATSTAGNSNPSEIEMVDDEIDFGEDPPSSESSSGFVHVNKSDNGSGNIEETYINVEDSNVICDVEGKVARGDEAKFVLEFRKSRSQFLNNLFEIEAFFVQFHLELTNNDDKSSSFSTDRTSRFGKYDIQSIGQVLSKVRQIMETMNQEKNCILFQMNDSPCYLENVKEKFASKSKQISESIIKADLLVDRMKDLEMQIKETELLLKRSIISAKELQEKVENSLVELYRGRSINIMGCVS